MDLEELKRIQSRVIKKNKMCDLFGTIIFIVFCFCFFVLFSFSFNENSLMFIFFSFFFILTLSFIFTAIIKIVVNGEDIKKFKKNFKDTFVVKALGEFFDDLTYEADRGFLIDYIKSVGMLDTGDRYYSSDYISGKYKNIGFEQADIHIEEEREEKNRDGEKKVVFETTFLGRLMIFDFNKKFNTAMQVASYRFNANILPWGKKYKKVQMENQEFNQKFTIYAENEHDAYYILTPHFMEKLMDITEKVKCGVMFCFIDSKLHVAINNYIDSFEYNIFEKIDEEKIKNSILKDIKLITDFVDELNLDNNLFRR